MKQSITPVIDNLDKQLTYRKQMKRYEIAVKSGFYLEAMVIVYSMIEDRCLAFLDHAGVANRNDLKVYSKVRNDIRSILSLGENEKLTIRNINNKLAIIRKIVIWASNSSEISEKERYKYLLKSHLAEKIEINELLEVLNEIEKWCDTRNEYIHALLNKNRFDAEKKLKDFVESGYLLARKLDNIENRFKRNNKIKKCMNL